MEKYEKLEQLVQEATIDTSWREDFQHHLENEEAEDFYFEVSLRIIERLEELGWKKSELAAKLGTSNQYVSKMLRTIQNPSIKTIFKIQDVLGIKLIGIPEPKIQSKTEITIKIRPQALSMGHYEKSYLGEIIYPNQTHITRKWLENQESSYQCDC